MSRSPHVQSPLMNLPGGVIASPSFLGFALSIIVGAVFIYAGATKAWDPFTFANDIEHYRILSWPLGMRLAFYLPWLEILCGIALIVGRLRTGAIAITSGLMLVFIAVTIAAKVRGIDLSCGCFGHASKGLSFTTHLLLDLILLGALLFLWIRRSRQVAD